MIHHVAVFTWNEGVTSAQVAVVQAALADLQAELSVLERYEFGPDLGWNAWDGDFVVHAVLADDAGWRIYDQHPLHAQLRSEVLGPLTAARAVVQFRT